MEKSRKNKAIETIKKLLAVTVDRGATKNEAQVALTKARELMLKYKITEDSITDNIDKKDIINEVLKDYNFKVNWVYALASVFFNNFPIFHYVIDDRDKRYLALFGKELDVKCVITLFKCAYLFVTKASTNYYNEYKKLFGKSDNIKESYIYGFINGLADKYEEQNKNKQFSLLLIPTEDVKNSFNDFCKDFEKQSINFNNVNKDDIMAANAGYIEGKKFGTTPLASGKYLEGDI